MELQTTNPKDWENLSEQAKSYANQFLNFSKTSTENTIGMCEIIYEAKQNLTWQAFDSLCKAIGYDPQSASIKKYIKIGEYADKFKPYLERLPNTWTTLYEITHLPEDKFIEAINQGKITSSTLGSDIRSLTKPEKSNVEVEPIAKIILELHKDFAWSDWKKMRSELEAMTLEYKFSIELAASTVDLLVKNKR